MPQAQASIQQIAIATPPQMPATLDVAQQVNTCLVETGFRTITGYLHDETLRQLVTDGEIDLLIAVGGDGTMLRAGHLCGPAKVPILGINMGRFGFLIEVQVDQWRKLIPRLKSGEYWLEQRMMLAVAHWRDHSLLGNWDALNEVAVGRSEYLRPVHLSAYLDGRFLTTYVADALIASTATGSTAYALAAGGPILPPELRNILLVPVAPHLSVERAIVLAEGSTIGITVISEHEASCSVDGQPPMTVLKGDRIEARASEHTVQFVRFQDPGYFYRYLTPHMSQNPSTGNLR
ncbi:MAG TPA: NAD(+)/NADH kinase [Anaerolineales bacterium]|nr:NAD(+)/NADH kinase [Anaerolineales bacterium]